MPPKRTKIRLLGTAICLLAISGGFLFFNRSPFDPKKVATAETRMWQAYYTLDKQELGFQLIVLLREQYGASIFEAKEIGERLARSAMVFRQATGNYEQQVLPDLTKAYQRIQKATGADFDPEKAARAELAWWVARRTPGQNSPENVGLKIAELYAVLYGQEVETFNRAGVLRAEAASIRDEGGRQADWQRVETLLKESYRELVKTL